MPAIATATIAVMPIVVAGRYNDIGLKDGFDKELPA
jgi:hypothetical protein